MNTPLLDGIRKTAAMSFEDLTDPERMDMLARLYTHGSSGFLNMKSPRTLQDIPEAKKEKAFASMEKEVNKQLSKLEKGRRVTMENFGNEAARYGLLPIAGLGAGLVASKFIKHPGWKDAAPYAGTLAGLSVPVISAFARKRPPQEERVETARQQAQRVADIVSAMRKPENLGALESWAKDGGEVPEEAPGYFNI